MNNFTRGVGGGLCCSWPLWVCTVCPVVNPALPVWIVRFTLFQFWRDKRTNEWFICNCYCDFRGLRNIGKGNRWKQPIKKRKTQNQTVCLKLNSVLSRYGSELSEYRERVLKCHYHGRLVKTTIEKRSSDQTDSLLESVFLVKGGETEKY